MTNPIKRLAGQTVIYGLSSILGRMLNYLLVPLYTRIFVTGEYGIVTEMYAYVSFLAIIVTYGMETGYFRFAGVHSHPAKVFSTGMISLFGTSLLFVVAMSASSGGLSSWMGYAGHPEYIVWLSMIVALDAFTAIPFARLRQENKALRFALIRLVNIGVNIGLNLFWLVYCRDAYENGTHAWISHVYDPTIGVGYVFLSNLFASLVTTILLLPQIFVKWTFDFKLWKEMMVYSLPLLVGGMAGMVNETVDRILLKYMITDHAVAMDQLGIYGANYKVAILMTIFIQTFRFAAEPFFFGQAKEKGNKELYAKVMHYFVIFCAAIFLGVMLYIDVVKLFIGSEFREGIKVVPILLMANFFLGIFYNLSIWYKLTNQTKFGAWLAIFGAVITIILNLILIPIIGYMGAAWATFNCYFLMMVVSYFIGQKYFPVPYKLVRTGFYIVIAPAVWGLSLILPDAVSGMAINSVLFIGFLATVYLLERKKIRGNSF
ncbi:MAG: polysaccharide biosynthesis protein [Bacteroidetes bacterium HGW-Bacteroidetes-21]|jgi:O-antigen/teichoic acid export membrane protein|nr:MAG: polysaccharide biosynthesis protein [Bacteroidetes bacterium HGW-Bacteroidetes-21]